MIASKHSCKVLHQQNPPWKATKKIKHFKIPSPALRTSERTWARSNVEKAHTFTEHLAKVFEPHPSENEPKEEEEYTTS
jgi:hypothetical protein